MISCLLLPFSFVLEGISGPGWLLACYRIAWNRLGPSGLSSFYGNFWVLASGVLALGLVCLWVVHVLLLLLNPGNASGTAVVGQRRQ